MPIVGQFGSLARAGSFLLPGGAMESIATVTVGSGRASSIEFANIPSAFQHLQLRMIVQQYDSNVANAGNIYTLARLNGDTTAGNYTTHMLSGNGSSAGASALTGSAYTYAYVAQSYCTPSSSIFSPIIIDILDYASTTKNKTLRTFSGWDGNGSGSLALHSNLWLSTSAVNTLTIFPNVPASVTSFAQYTTAALYGIRA